MCAENEYGSGTEFFCRFNNFSLFVVQILEYYARGWANEEFLPPNELWRFHENAMNMNNAHFMMMKNGSVCRLVRYSECARMMVDVAHSTKNNNFAIQAEYYLSVFVSESCVKSTRLEERMKQVVELFNAIEYLWILSAAKVGRLFMSRAWWVAHVCTVLEHQQQLVVHYIYIYTVLKFDSVSGSFCSELESSPMINIYIYISRYRATRLQMKICT